MTTKSYATVKVEKEDGITWVILNRPEKRNAMNAQLHFDMLDAISELETDKETKVLILTGAGNSWCAGQYQHHRLPWYRLLSPSTLRQYLVLLLKGRKIQNYGKDDYYQAGGDFLVDRDGKVIFSYRSHDP